MENLSSSSRMWSCNACRAMNKEFVVPADPIGTALMQQHLRDEHRVINGVQQPK